jgi:uncharacterized membrane protein YbhN (UPF0104 family)
MPIFIIIYLVVIYFIFGALSADYRDKAWSERHKPPYTRKERTLRFWLWPFYWSIGIVFILVGMVYLIFMSAIGKKPDD